MSNLKTAKHPKVRPFLEYFSQSLPKVHERKFTRLTWIFKKSSQLQCLLMSLKNRKKCITVHSFTSYVRSSPLVPSSDGPDYIVLSKVDYSSINVDPMRSLSFMHQKTIPKSYMWMHAVAVWEFTRRFIFCCIVAWIQPDNSGCQQYFLLFENEISREHLRTISKIFFPSYHLSGQIICMYLKNCPR